MKRIRHKRPIALLLSACLLCSASACSAKSAAGSSAKSPSEKAGQPSDSQESKSEGTSVSAITESTRSAENPSGVASSSTTGSNATATAKLPDVWSLESISGFFALDPSSDTKVLNNVTMSLPGAYHDDYGFSLELPEYSDALYEQMIEKIQSLGFPPGTEKKREDTKYIEFFQEEEKGYRKAMISSLKISSSAAVNQIQVSLSYSMPMNIRIAYPEAQMAGFPPLPADWIVHHIKWTNDSPHLPCTDVYINDVSEESARAYMSALEALGPNSSDKAQAPNELTYYIEVPGPGDNVESCYLFSYTKGDDGSTCANLRLTLREPW